MVYKASTAEIQLLTFLNNCKKDANYKEITHHFLSKGLSESTAQNALEGALAKGFIEQISSVYIITESGKNQI